jgi:hypothetical protein
MDSVLSVLCVHLLYLNVCAIDNKPSTSMRIKNAPSVNRRRQKICPTILWKFWLVQGVLVASNMRSLRTIRKAQSDAKDGGTGEVNPSAPPPAAVAAVPAPATDAGDATANVAAANEVNADGSMVLKKQTSKELQNVRQRKTNEGRKKKVKARDIRLAKVRSSLFGFEGRQTHPLLFFLPLFFSASVGVCMVGVCLVVCRNITDIAFPILVDGPACRCTALGGGLGVSGFH